MGDVSRDFVGDIPSLYVTTLLSLWSIGFVKMEYNNFYLSLDNDIEVSRDFLGGVLLS